MENKLLTYILQMQKQSSTQSVPRLPKAQKGKTVKGKLIMPKAELTGYPSQQSSVLEGPTMNVASGTIKPTYKTISQKEILDQKEAERLEKFRAAQQRDFENRSYISQDRSTPASREADRQRFLEAKRQEAMANSDLAQTFGSFTPSGYNPGAGSVAANQFVKTMPLIAGSSLAATEVLPYLNTALNTPMGVAGLTGNNVINSAFAYEAAKNLPNVGRSIKTAYQKPTLNNIGNATAETALTALNALPFAAEASKGVAPIVNEIKNTYGLGLTAAEKNLRDLQYAKSVYGPLGYQIPENLKRIAQSDELTNRTIRGLVDRDNTVFRGVNVDLDALKSRLLNKTKTWASITGKTPKDAIDKFDLIIKDLKTANVDIDNPEEVAKYMATHIPRETGAGRANLDVNELRKKGIDALYTSNSQGTAEGYTYGQGYVVKAKKPTDFSSSNRKKWIDNNNPNIQTQEDYNYSRITGKPITWKTDYEIATPQFINNYREKLGREKLLSEYPEIGTLNNYSWERESLHPEYQKILNREDQLKQLAEDELEIAAEPYRDKLFNIKDRRDRRVMKYDMNNTPNYQRALKNLTNPSFIRDLIMEGRYQDKLNVLNKKNADEWMKASVTPYLEKYPELLNEMPQVNPYAHYIHIGKPGTKVLEPVSIRKITPEIWKNQSRGHEGAASRQATKREFGGGIENEFAWGGYYDCPDQEKDPVTGKCKAEEVRSKEQAAANKAAGADLNAWAKQVAAMDKENARQDAAQYAGQLGFDYDWMQSPVEKAEKKAAIAQYKQFFQQNPKTFVPDDTSGFSPEQKYIIASKLKQKASTPMGSKAFQQKFNQDPRFMDLGRIQSDIVPTMGGWPAVRNWMFNNKQFGGPIVDPRGQWAHPGQVTRIPSNNITMQGVPYPVLGVGSNGQRQMMYPGRNYSFGGAEHVDEYPMMANGGYTVTRSDAREGKTHKVTGPDGTVKYFGDSNLGQHPKDPERKAAFYARHKSNLEGNPFFRAYARETWEEGGETEDDKEMLSGVADILRRVRDTNNRKELAKYMMNNFREEDVTFEPNAFLKSANVFAKGGEMIRRADGSYSRRGLWDNIRANKGSGKKPTKQMLEQERKINNMQYGGLPQFQVRGEFKPIIIAGQTIRPIIRNVNPDDMPHFSVNKNPQDVEPWTDPVLDRIERDNNEKYRDRDSRFENILEFLDPTGISSWDDVARSFRNPSASGLERGVNLFSALPYVGKLGKLAKGAKAVTTTAKASKLQKVGRAALKGVDIITGGPAMRYFDQSISPISRGFGTITEKAVEQIPYKGVRKAFEIGSDFNQMRRFSDGVISPAFERFDRFMTQPTNTSKQK
jgi:hypothetical protein